MVGISSNTKYSVSTPKMLNVAVILLLRSLPIRVRPQAHAAQEIGFDGIMNRTNSLPATLQKVLDDLAFRVWQGHRIFAGVQSGRENHETMCMKPYADARSGKQNKRKHRR